MTAFENMEVCNVRKTALERSTEETSKLLDMAHHSLEALNDTLEQVSWNMEKYLEASDALLDKMMEDDAISLEDLSEGETTENILYRKTESVMRRMKNLIADMDEQESEDETLFMTRSRRFHFSI